MKKATVDIKKQPYGQFTHREKACDFDLQLDRTKRSIAGLEIVRKYARILKVVILDSANVVRNRAS